METFKFYISLIFAKAW